MGIIMLGDHNHRSCATLLMILTLGVPAISSGQAVASSLEQLRGLVKIGDNVIVTDIGGRQTRGRIVRDDISARDSAAFIVESAAIGVGIGFAVDAMIKGSRVIYSRSSTSASASARQR